MTRYVAFLRAINISGRYVHGREVVWLYRPSLGTSKFSNTKLERLLQTDATNRNMRTIDKLVEMFP